MNNKELLEKADELIKKANELKELATKKEEVILVPDEIKISKLNWKLAIHNWNQKLWYDNIFWHWIVVNSIWKVIKCKLTPCKYEDLKPWDVFYRDDYIRRFNILALYAIKLKDWSFQFWGEWDCRNQKNTREYYWRVEPINS